jgi:hypothetical protein
MPVLDRTTNVFVKRGGDSKIRAALRKTYGQKQMRLDTKFFSISFT